MTNRRRNKDSRRKKRASKAIDELSTVLLSYGTTDSETVDAAARDILRIGKRHGERPDSQITRLICRGCEAALIPGRNARFRISDGMLIITCKDCGRIGRSGPDF
jgi:RNase P subunit RPR2